MNPFYLKWGGITSVVLALMLGAGAAAWSWQANRYGKIIATNEAAREADLTSIANAAAVQSRQALEKQQAVEKGMADLDTKSTEEKKNALAENEALRQRFVVARADNARLYTAAIAGHDRLRIAGSCNPGSSNLSSSASSASLGDAGTIERSPDTGSSLFDIRAGIIADQAALKALQAYVKDVCLAY